MSSKPTIIWVLEDNDEDFELLEMALEQVSVIVETIRFRRCEALIPLIENHELPRPAVIYLDIRMPGISGLETLQQLNQIETCKPIPKLVFSTSANPVEISEAYKNGANAFHVKNVETSEMLQLLERTFGYWLKHVQLPPKDAIGQLQTGGRI